MEFLQPVWPGSADDLKTSRRKLVKCLDYQRVGIDDFIIQKMKGKCHSSFDDPIEDMDLTDASRDVVEGCCFVNMKGITTESIETDNWGGMVMKSVEAHRWYT